MTKQQALDKIDKMIAEYYPHKLREECARLLESGGVDLEAYENDFRLPKIVLSTALKNEAWQFKPHTKEDQKAAKNLEVF